jgi:hypothetical protein
MLTGIPQMTWFPSIQDAPFAFCWQDRERVTPGLVPPKAQCNFPALTSMCADLPKSRGSPPFMIWERHKMLAMFFHSLQRHTPQGSKTIQIFNFGPSAGARLHRSKEGEGYKF